MSNEQTLRDARERVMWALAMTEEGHPDLPMPDERARQKVVSELSYRDGRLSALLSLDEATLAGVAYSDVVGEASGALGCVDAVLELSEAYRTSTPSDWRETYAASYFGLGYLEPAY